ncbi:MAG: hypothetical protein M1817_005705 [Caeruleum heppii]|nr:MAG: hypothetical protein M1817_005705 [Caeruleum heppii]
MPYLPTSAEWLQQSALLIEARPSTTRITSKYTLPHTSKPAKPAKPTKTTKPSDSCASAQNTKSSDPSTSAPTPRPLSALLTLKTYDPVSGVVLKYRTNKGAEVGRLVGALERLGRGMCRVAVADPSPSDVNLAPPSADIPTESNTPIRSSTPVPSTSIPAGEATSGGGGGGGGGQGGGKAKSKGKKKGGGKR